MEIKALFNSTLTLPKTIVIKFSSLPINLIGDLEIGPIHSYKIANKQNTLLRRYSRTNYL